MRRFLVRSSLLFTAALAACHVAAPIPDGGCPGAVVAPFTPQGAAPAFTTWAQDAVLYHVYVRSFFDSDGDGQGDLPGLASKLDYIQSLGVDGLLLLPIQVNDHPEWGGYATRDYDHVDPMYGGDGAWTAFITEAHSRGLKVLLDLSLTHVSENHAWFQSATANTCHAEHQDFTWLSAPCPVEPRNIYGFAPAWQLSDDLGQCFHTLYDPSLPSLNPRSTHGADSILQVVTSWIAKGADGFRLDSAPSMGEMDPASPTTEQPSNAATHAMWLSVMQAMKSTSASSMAVGEIFTPDATQLTPYYADGMDMAFDYPIWLSGIAPALQGGGKSGLETSVAAELAARPSGALGGVFLDNHDVPGSSTAPYGRVADLVGGNVTRLQTAALLLFSLPSTPFVYYGDEIGLRGAPLVDGGVADSRNPMQWDGGALRGFTTGAAWRPFADVTANVDAEEQNAASLLQTYRGLISTRKGSPALQHGAYQDVATTSSNVYAFLRTTTGPAQKILVVLNFGGTAGGVTIDLHSADVDTGAVSDFIFGGSSPFPALPAVTSGNSAHYTLGTSDLPAYAGRWLLIQ